MTNLNDRQEQLLETVRTTYDDVLPVLKRMQEDFEYATYRAKKPIRDAVDAALEGKVPMARIVNDATDLGYAQKLKVWLRPSDDLVKRLTEDTDVPIQATETYAEDIESIETVSRNPNNGEFRVMYGGEVYTVAAMGPDEEPWASTDGAVPQGAYDLISKKYPGFVVLEDDD